jgi:hypothetical protein
VRQQGEVLEHHAHLVPADLDHLFFGGGKQVPAVEDHLAGGRLDQARHATHERRFARAREAHDDEDLAFVDVEARVTHGANQAGLRKLLVTCLVVAFDQERFGVGAEDFPYVFAREFDASLPPVRFARAVIAHRRLPGGVAYYGIM